MISHGEKLFSSLIISRCLRTLFFPPKTFSFSSVISYPSSAGERKA